MANPQKGEMEFEIGGKVYTYLLGTYGLAKLEQRQGKPWPLILQGAVNNGWGVDIALACFHCGLLLHHEGMTEREASLLLDEFTLNRFTAKFIEAVQFQFPDQDGERARPMAAVVKATNGSGTGLSATG